MSEESPKVCFVIAPIGEPESEIRKRSDQILRHVISPAVESRGYKAVRADELDKPGLITSQVIQHVVEDPLVVADLTDRNPNVFYELAIRHAIRKPIIQIIRKGESIPFDVAGTRTIFVDHQDLDNVESAKSSILEQIDSLEEDSSDLESPISVSLDLQRLRQSENPEQRSLADLVSILSEIKSDMSTFEEKLEANADIKLDGREFHMLVRQLSDVVEHAASNSRTERRQRVDPLSILRITHSLKRTSESSLVLPVVLGPLREDAPWLYEVGMKLFEQLEANDYTRALTTAEQLVRLSDLTRELIEQRPELRGFVIELIEYLDYLRANVPAQQHLNAPPRHQTY